MKKILFALPALLSIILNSCFFGGGDYKGAVVPGTLALTMQRRKTGSDCRWTV